LPGCPRPRRPGGSEMTWEALSARLAARLFARFEGNRGAAASAALFPPALERLRSTVARFAADVEPLVAAADRATADDSQYAREVLVRAAQAGLLTRFLPRWAGGEASVTALQRRGSVPILMFVEELGAVSPGLATLLGAHYLGAMPILLSFDVAAMRRLLRPLCERLHAGDPAICAFAITEPEAGSDVEDAMGAQQARLCTRARRCPGGYVLSGRKVFISGGNLAALTTVFATLEPQHGIEGWTCFAVRMDTPGVQVVRVEDKMGQRISPAAELCFEEVFVPEECRVGPERRGWELNRVTLDLSRPLVGGLALGAARTVIGDVLAWAERNGLGADRLFHHAAARWIGAYAAAHALVVRACRVVPPLPDLSAMAKFVATDTAMRIVSEAMEWIGLEATVVGSRIERLYRDLRLTQIYEGTNEINRLAVFERVEHGQPLSWPRFL